MFGKEMRRVSRRGFTLVEMLVVIAIIGVLVSLLMPAIQAARESARRMSCGNKLHQIGVAAHAYHDHWQRFPLMGNFTSDITSNSPYKNYNASRGSFMARLLPFMEEQWLYDMLNFDLSGPTDHGAPDLCAISMAQPGDALPGNGIRFETVCDGRGKRLRSYVISGLLCPSASIMVGSGQHAGENVREAAALTTYAYNLGAADMVNASGACAQYANAGGYFKFTNHPGMAPQGLTDAGFNSSGVAARGIWAASLDDIQNVDGAAHTILIGEYLPDDSAFNAGDSTIGTIGGDALRGWMNFDTGWNTTNCPVNHPMRGIDLIWDTEKYGPFGPCNDREIAVCAQGFRSDHPGVIQVVMADASVQVIADEIDYAVWQALGDRRDGTVVEAAMLSP